MAKEYCLMYSLGMLKFQQLFQYSFTISSRIPIRWWSSEHNNGIKRNDQVG